jgi:hypothetical protein
LRCNQTGTRIAMIGILHGDALPLRVVFRV